MAMLQRRPIQVSSPTVPGAVLRIAIAIQAFLPPAALGCSFLATTAPWDAAHLDYANEFMQRRGPDGTRCTRMGGVTACHNLLHMTGELVPQPLVHEDGGIIAVYNGEVYNFRELAKQLGLGPVRSDGEVIVPLYRAMGESFARLLDGEFAVAIIDLHARRAILATDVFSTKPLWFSRRGGLRVATYRSAVERMGAPPGSIRMVDPNTILAFGLDPEGGTADVPFLGRAVAVEFDTRQFKQSADDFLAAFQRAVEKRMRSNHGVFIGLSSGYDSGAIQVALKEAGQAHAAYTIYSTEDISTIERRIAWTGELAEPNVIVLSEEDRAREEAHLRRHCEHFDFSGLGRQGALVDDPASHGLSYIFREVRERGMLVYLSGTGADEIISDYGFGGNKFFPHSSFGGLFPEDLATIFPWPSFFIGTQRDYLMKEELVAGTHGIEGRYPFLDRFVVQEYLWLAASAKNSIYKAPLHSLLAGRDYPFIQGQKVGFNADWNTREGGESLVMTRKGVERRRSGVERPAPPCDAGAELAAEGDAVAAQLAEAAVQRAAIDGTLRGAEAAREAIARREADLGARITGFDEERLQRIQMYLFVMVPRMTQMRRAAATVMPKARAGEGASQPVHERWGSVEVVTCVSGGRHLMVADFPVFDIFRETTPLPTVHNICEDVEWEGMHFRLKAYARFFREVLRQKQPAGLPVLYLVSDGLDVFFNDLSEAAGLGDLATSDERALATARLLAERYEAVASSSGTRKPIVFSTERLCGWGGAKLCSEEDEARYPESPTDSKYLNAGGYMGPAGALSEMIDDVLLRKESADEVDTEKGRDSDQYFFKRYFWDNKHMIALDYGQTIFGNFLEIVNKLCENDWVPLCAVKPCCTESDHFKTFHSTFYGRYDVRRCSVWRQGNLPASWHGNGAGKWLWLLALDRLSLQCGTAANFTLARYPQEMLRGVFDKFERRALQESGTWAGGFLLRQATGLIELPEGGLPAECS